MLLRCREADAGDDEQRWVYDTWAAVKDEIGAAMGLSPRRASGQLRLAEALAERLPRVAELLEQGVITLKVAATIVYRTEHVLDAAHTVVDTEIAARAGGFGVLSDTELELAIDAVVEEHDPDASRRFRDAATSCDVQFGKPEDATGTRSMFGRIMAADGDVAIGVLNAMADTVCKKDPRSRGQLRAAAFGAFFHGFDRLVCHCGDPDCAAATIPSKVSKIVIHILADQATLDTALAEAAAYAEEQRTRRHTTEQSDTPPADTPPAETPPVETPPADGPTTSSHHPPTPPDPPPTPPPVLSPPPPVRNPGGPPGPALLPPPSPSPPHRRHPPSPSLTPKPTPTPTPTP